jgi:hypothetical protein
MVNMEFCVAHGNDSTNGGLAAARKTLSLIKDKSVFN